MKIGIISNLYPPFVRGGAEVIAAMQAEGLKKAWQHVFVISSRPAKIPVYGHSFSSGRLWGESKDEINNIDVYRFNPVNLYYYLDDFKYPAFIRGLWHLWDTFNIFSYFKVKKILLEQKPDLLITHNLMGLGFLLPRLIKRLKIKHVHIVHDVQLVTPSGLIIRGRENSIEHRFFRVLGYKRIMRWLMGSPEIVISPSRFLLDFYQQHAFFPNSKKVVLPNPVKFLINIEKNPSPDLELVYLGQINKAKGVLGLIESFRKINLPHLKLHIVGIGQDFIKAKELAAKDKRIFFHGWLPNENLLSLLSRTDVMVLPSLCYENSPTVIYESLSMGMPVLAADIGGSAELIQEGKNGWIFPAGDFAMMSKKIEDIYRQREAIKLMADNCRQSVAAFVLDKYNQKLLDIINE
ncbi:MAG: glycosyltransferase [Patescibacteria group bacterium]|nr:glycosyltransferase [Patescibacteria group bacterium]